MVIIYWLRLVFCHHLFLLCLREILCFILVNVLSRINLPFPSWPVERSVTTRLHTQESFHWSSIRRRCLSLSLCIFQWRWSEQWTCISSQIPVVYRGQNSNKFCCYWQCQWWGKSFFVCDSPLTRSSFNMLQSSWSISGLE